MSRQRQRAMKKIGKILNHSDGHVTPEDRIFIRDIAKTAGIDFKKVNNTIADANSHDTYDLGRVFDNKERKIQIVRGGSCSPK